MSPAEGPVSVDWHRTSITVRNRKGWRPDIAYTVTILSGLQDLSGNSTRKPLQTVFSTGNVIPHAEIRGVAFDWAAQQPVSGARVEAMIGSDTALKFIAVADSTGRFVMTTLPPGTLRVRAYVDANTNHRPRPRELWDSASVVLADTASRELYMFAHDTIGPSLLDVTAIDSVTLRVKFDRPLLPGAPLDVSHFSLKLRTATKTDSVPVAHPRRLVGRALRLADAAAQGVRARLDHARRHIGRRAQGGAAAGLAQARGLPGFHRAGAGRIGEGGARHGRSRWNARSRRARRRSPSSSSSSAQPLPYDMFAHALRARRRRTHRARTPARVKQVVSGNRRRRTPRRRRPLQTAAAKEPPAGTPPPPTGAAAEESAPRRKKP